MGIDGISLPLLELTLLLSFLCAVYTLKVLPNRDVGWRPLLAGAIAGGVGLELLKAE